MDFYVSWLEFFWNLFASFQSTISQHWLKYDLSWNGRQAIIWTNGGAVYWCICMYTSPSLNELIIYSIISRHGMTRTHYPTYIINIMTADGLDMHGTKESTPMAPLIAKFMGPIWGRQDPGGSHVGPMNLAIWDYRLVLLEHCGLITRKAYESIHTALKPDNTLEYLSTMHTVHDKFTNDFCGIIKTPKQKYLSQTLNYRFWIMDILFLGQRFVQGHPEDMCKFIYYKIYVYNKKKIRSVT